MGLGKFIGDILGKAIGNIMVIALTALFGILIIQYVFGIDIIGFFF